MNEYKRKKSNYKNKRPAYRRTSGFGSTGGGGSYRQRPPPYMPRRDYSYKTEQKNAPKEERSHWNGKVEVWTEPQKPRQEKVIKYEVDTDKLLNELARRNKENLDEITEKLERETKEEPNPEKSDSEITQSDNSETTDRESGTHEHSEVNESVEDSDTKTETNTDSIEAEPESEIDEHQETSQDESPEPEQPSEDPLDDPLLIFMEPSFWEQLENELSDELEQLEPEEEAEYVETELP